METKKPGNPRSDDRFWDSLGRPPRLGTRGPGRSRFYTTECIQADALRLQDFIRSETKATLLEFPGLNRAVRVERIDATTLGLHGLPGLLEDQQVEFELDERHGAPGPRAFFRCPRCGARRRILYVPLRLTGLACRACWGLAYPPRKPAFDRLLAEHALQAEALAALVQLRATDLTHHRAPATDAEIEAHVTELLRRAEDLSKRLARELPPAKVSAPPSRAGNGRPAESGEGSATEEGQSGQRERREVRATA